MVPPWRRQNLDLRGDGDIKKAFLYNMVCIYIYTLIDSFICLFIYSYICIDICLAHNINHIWVCLKIGYPWPSTREKNHIILTLTMQNFRAIWECIPHFQINPSHFLGLSGESNIDNSALLKQFPGLGSDMLSHLSISYHCVSLEVRKRCFSNPHLIEIQ